MAIKSKNFDILPIIDQFLVYFSKIEFLDKNYNFRQVCEEQQQ